MLGIFRAAVTNIRNLGTDRRLVGASTTVDRVRLIDARGSVDEVAARIEQALEDLRP